MHSYKQFICPVSGERIDENTVRLTAFLVIMVMGIFLFTGSAVLPLLLAADFFLRAFTKLTYSPLSWISGSIIKTTGLKPVLIDKGPKIFAARIGFLLVVLTTMFSLLGFQTIPVVIGSVLVAFAFLECGLNFCAGCWIYSRIVYPIVRNSR